MGQLDLSNWLKTPVIKGRVATHDDVASGVAAFCLPEGSAPYSMLLPACAILIATGAPVIVVQAEQYGSQVVMGAKFMSGKVLVCGVEELHLLREPDERFVVQ